MIDLAIVATLSSYLVFGMIRFMVDRRRSSEKTEPFYIVIRRWNQGGKQQQQQQQQRDKTKVRLTEEKCIRRIRQDALLWLLRGALVTLVSTVPFGILDGFLRVCNPPPDGPYISSFLEKGYIPVRTLYYYGVCSIALFLHLAIVPTFMLLIYGLELSARSLLYPDSLEKHHLAVEEFVQRPPLFDRPWASTSIHNLWSRRWHRMFRWAFKDIVYLPIRHRLARYPLLRDVLSAMGVFVLSGLMHDYILLVMTGPHHYWTTPGVAGAQTMFFVLQGIASVISKEHGLKIPRWLAFLLTWSFLLHSAPLFIEPYILIGLNRIAWIPGYPRFQDPYLGHICPYGAALINNCIEPT
ncbi:membrane bound O-acyl transferase family-domain-containing protein [Dichotomocladium elegans]|nr:membrane bound O-acyl transferase family-domain-containing protein [Dichotomocladium elegans]